MSSSPSAASSYQDAANVSTGQPPTTSAQRYASLADALKASETQRFMIIRTPGGTVYSEYGKVVAQAQFQSDVHAAQIAQAQQQPKNVYGERGRITVTTSSQQPAAPDSFTANYLPQLGVVGVGLTQVYRTPEFLIRGGTETVNQALVEKQLHGPSAVGAAKFLAGETMIAAGGFASFVNPNAVKIDFSRPEILGAEAVGIGAQMIVGGYAIGGAERALGVAGLTGRVTGASRPIVGRAAPVLGESALLSVRFGEGALLGAGESVISGENVYEGALKGGAFMAGGTVVFQAAAPVVRGLAQPVRNYFATRTAASRLSKYGFYPQFEESQALAMQNIRSGTVGTSKLADEFRFVKDLQENPNAPEIIRRIHSPSPSDVGLPRGYASPGEGGSMPVSARARAGYEAVRRGAAELNAEKAARDVESGARTLNVGRGSVQVIKTRPLEKVEFKPVEEYQVKSGFQESSIDKAIAESRGAAEARITRIRRPSKMFVDEFIFMKTPESYVAPSTSIFAESKLDQGFSLDLGVGLNLESLTGSMLSQSTVVKQVLRQETRLAQVTALENVTSVKTVSVTMPKVGFRFDTFNFQVPMIDVAPRGMFAFRMPKPRKVKTRHKGMRYTEFVRPHQLSENILAEEGLANLGALIFG